MKTRNAVLAGIGTAAGLVIAATGFRTVQYGPRSQEEARAGENVAEVMSRLGAPYATYTAGDQTVYRWGSGTQRNYFIVKTFDHDELLVTTGADGRISSSKFLDKANGTQVFGFISMPPLP